MKENKSLRANLDVTDKIDELKLAINSEIGSKLLWVLVEGDDDCKLYAKFVKEESVKVEFVNGGKLKLEIALQELIKKTNRVIGIRDADFTHLERNYSNIVNLFFTDFHDIEMTMLSFENVRNNFASEYQIKDFEGFWSEILNEASYVGYIRWYNEKNNCSINFKGLKYGDIIEIEAAKVKSFQKDKLLDVLNERSKNKTTCLSHALIDSFTLSHKTSDLLNLCNGHDVSDFIALFVGGIVSKKEFQRHLRLSFQMVDFARTDLYADLNKWQNMNGFELLREVN